MFAAMKVLVPIGMGLVGLVAFSQKANAAPGTPAKPAPSGGTPPRPRAGTTPKAGSMTTEQVVKEMTAALSSADPKVLLALADKIEKAGFADQAKDLRGLADTLSKVGAQAAGTKAPPIVPPGKPATPLAQIPQASPAASVSVPPPVAGVTPSPGVPPFVPQSPSPGNVTTLPEMVITPGDANAPTTAERALVANFMIDQQSKPKWQDNRQLTTLVQKQEATKGRYKNILTGAPGLIDGLYGPGVAIGIAENYGMVPPNPKYWPTNPAPSLSAYKARLTKLAADDPARASEWLQAAANAKAQK